MHYFLIIYLFSTTSVLVTEFSTYKECIQAKKTIAKELKNSGDLEAIECEKGYILEEYDGVYLEKE